MSERRSLDSDVIGLGHVALRVADMAAARRFYEDLLGFEPMWDPDAEHAYLASPSRRDNLALHLRDPRSPVPDQENRAVDHIGIFLRTKESVVRWCERLESAGALILRPVRDHRDGSRSFYVADPDGNVVQMLFEPNVADTV